MNEEKKKKKDKMPPAAGGDHPPRTPWMGGGNGGGKGRRMGAKGHREEIWPGCSVNAPGPPGRWGLQGGGAAAIWLPPSGRVREGVTPSRPPEASPPLRLTPL